MKRGLSLAMMTVIARMRDAKTGSSGRKPQAAALVARVHERSVCRSSPVPEPRHRGQHSRFCPGQIVDLSISGAQVVRYSKSRLDALA